MIPNKLIIYAVLSIIGFLIVTSTYYVWRKGVEREALLEYNQKQLEQNIKDQKEMREKLNNIAIKQKEIDEANNADKKAFQEKIDNISSSLESKEAVAADRPASQILKDTISKLKDVTQ